MAVAKNAKSYIPNKIRSHPLKCLSLPVYLVFFFILYWFIMCPLIFESVENDYENSLEHTWTRDWPYYFWIMAFLLFVLLLSIFICLWRCTPNYVRKPSFIENGEKEPIMQKTKKKIRRKSKSLYNVSVQNLGCASDDEKKCNGNDDFAKMDSDFERLSSISLDDLSKDVEKIFPRCSVRRKPNEHQSKQTKFDNTTEKTKACVEPNVNQRFSPREQFFKDFYRSVHENDVKATKTFIEMEKKNCEGDKVKCAREYFIASVSPSKSCKSEVFMYVNEK